MATSKQVKPKTSKKVPNPTGKGGFQERPQDRATGHWDSKLVFSYQYRRFMQMSLDDIEKFQKLPAKRKTAVEVAACEAVTRARRDLGYVKEITDRTEGRATQLIDVTSAGEPIKTALVEFVGGDGRQSQDPDTN